MPSDSCSRPPSRVPLAKATVTRASDTAMPSEPIHNNGRRPIRSISTMVSRHAPMLSAPDSTLINSASFSEKPTACHSTAP